MLYHYSSVKKAATQELKVPLISMGKGHSRQVEMNTIKLNLSLVFEQWDMDKNGYLCLQELQVGLYAAGILIQHKRMCSILKKVAKKNDIDALRISDEYFPEFMASVCNNKPELLKHVLLKIQKMIPAERFSAPGFIKIKKQKGKTGGKGVDLQEQEDREHARLKGLEKVAEVEESDSLNYLRPDVMFEVLTFQRGVAPALIMFVLWQLGFSTFYCLYNDFRFDRAFYYSAQAGLSVGFGSLNEEYKTGMLPACNDYEDYPAKWSQGHSDISKLVTIINVLLGSSVIGGALGYFVDTMLAKQGEWFDNLKDVKIKAKRRKLLIQNKQNMALRCDYFNEWRENNANELKLSGIVITLLTSGLIFGVVEEDWSFITAIYYAVTAMSTGGLQGPDANRTSCMLFTAFFVLVGVPLYGVCLGFFANMLIAKSQAAREKATFIKSVGECEFEYAAALQDQRHKTVDPDEIEAEGGGSNASMLLSLERIEFLSMELLRTGKCDMDFLREVDKTFDEFDVDGSGTVTWIEMVAFNLFEQYDKSKDGVDGDGTLDIKEFQECLEDLCKPEFGLVTHSSLCSDGKFEEDMGKKVFAACNSSGDHVIDRVEFTVFVQALMAGDAELEKFVNAGPKLYQVLEEATGVSDSVDIDDSDVIFNVTPTQAERKMPRADSEDIPSPAPESKTSKQDFNSFSSGRTSST